jgi:hypothetical protein
VYDSVDIEKTIGTMYPLHHIAEDLLMKKWPDQVTEVNGFKVIQDFGRIGTRREGIALCKACNKEFETNLYYLHQLKSCGCLPDIIQAPLPKEINGFKIIKDLGRKNGKSRKAIVICKVCKKEHEAYAYYLKSLKHCGCLFPPRIECKYKRSHRRLFQIYRGMKARCYKENDKCYSLYGGKGIRVCNEWLSNADSFCEWALSNGYADDLSIDRINNEKDYYPENCRWSDTKTQARNRKGIKLTMEIARAIREDFKSMTRKELSEKYSIAPRNINRVLAGTRWAE